MAPNRIISPTSPIGEIFRYRVVGPPGLQRPDLKTIQDWILLRRLKSRARSHRRHRLGRQDEDLEHSRSIWTGSGLWATLSRSWMRLNNANINVGANTVNIGPQSAVVRSVGQIRSMADMGHTMLAVRTVRPSWFGRGHGHGRNSSRASVSPATTMTTTSCRASY